ncbi:Dihydrolipoyl dehydrogenase [Desulfosarcina cetonica]|nr:Dihydrolipoyl dehydrogenase [Desulfosarcina cetonica]
MKTFDVVIIGGGPGGMAAGITLSKTGKSVALIQDEKDSFGGICLNRGCMPTKSLLKAAGAYRHAKESNKYGLDMVCKQVDLQRLLDVTHGDLEQLRGMTHQMISMSKITAFRGKGSFLSDKEIQVAQTNGSTETVCGSTIIIATGSKPVELPFAPFDGRYILSTDHLLKNTELPVNLLIIGGGAVGCEFATLYNTFGSRVTIVEAMDTLLPREDREAGHALQCSFDKQGILVKTQTIIEKLIVNNGKVTVHYKGISTTDTVDKVLVGVGRRPNIEELNLDAAQIDTENGTLKVNDCLQTNVPHIYCIGDAAGGMMLAHAAEKEGQLLARNLIQETSLPLDETAVPRVAFSHPEVAAVGTTKEIDGIKAFTMPQVPNGRSIVDKVAPAFVKLYVRDGSLEIAGAIIIGEAATEMIHEIALAVENRLTLAQIGKTVHAHPTHSKNILQAVHYFN